MQTVDEFEQWEKQYPHEGNYEFVRGRIIPKPAMKQDEFYIADFLLRQSIRTTAFQAGHTLMPEGNRFTPGEIKAKIVEINSQNGKN